MNLALKIVVFMALAGIILLAATSLLKERQAERVPPRYFTVKRTDIERSVFGSGALRCSRRAEIVSKVAGKVRELSVQEGDAVKASNVLCKMTNDPIENEFAAAEKDFRFAKEEYDDKKRTHEQGGPPTEKELERLEWELDKKKKALAVLEEKVKNLTVTSPLNGTVLKSNLKKSEISLDPDRIYPEGTPFFVVGDLASLAVSGTILQSDRDEVKQGDPALVYCGSKGWLPGKVTHLPLVPEEGRFRVDIDFDSPASGLNEGLTVDFRIIVEKKSNVLAVPVEYVEVKDGRHLVKRVEGETVRRVPIEVGVSNYAFYEVKEGLNEGDVVRWDASEK